MLTTFAFAYIVLPAQALPVGPSLPWGASRTLQASVMRIEEQLSTGQFATAQKFAARLPKRKVVITWDDSSVPQSLRQDFAATRDWAFSKWKAMVSGLDFSLGKKGDIKFSFVKALAPNATSVGPPGAVFFDSDDPADPRLEAIFALHRTEQKIPTTKFDVGNEVGYAIGRYLGIEQMPGSGSFATRFDGSYGGQYVLAPPLPWIAQQNLDISEKVRALAAKKVKVAVARADAFLEPAELTHDNLAQGDPAEYTMSLTNRGNAPLFFSIVPDCSCFSFRVPQRVEPGQTQLLRIFANTVDFSGQQHKNLYFYANDADFTGRRVPVNFFVEPRYRVLTKHTGRIWLVDQRGAVLEYFFIPAPNKPLKPLSMSISGAKGAVDFEPWTGELLDPAIDSGPRTYSGYRVQILLNSDIPPGRINGSLDITTDDPKWATIRHGFELQKGMCSFPFSMYFGELSHATEGRVLVSYPGQKYKITSLKTNHPNFTATWQSAPNLGEYWVTIKYDGKATAGDVNAILIVETDSQSQPKLQVPIVGTVR